MKYDSLHGTKLLWYRDNINGSVENKLECEINYRVSGCVNNYMELNRPHHQHEGNLQTM